MASLSNYLTYFVYSESALLETILYQALHIAAYYKLKLIDFILKGALEK